MTDSRPSWIARNAGPLAVAALVGSVVGFAATTAAKPRVPNLAAVAATPTAQVPANPAPDLSGGVAWLNTAGPLKLSDLKGKVVVLDFWTLCCINCIHIMPDLAKLEKKYPNELVVIGVHSAKFENEKDTKSIKQAVLRYELAHPVVNDAEHAIWDRFGVRSWPTVVVIDPEGNLVGQVQGEGNYELLDKTIAKLVADADAKKVMNRTPTRFDLVRYRETADTPLFFPGKILADAPSNRLVVSDSTHHRVVVADLAGKVKTVVGAGAPGYADGPAAQAKFDDPQGLALDGDTLYVADRKNHVIRAVDLKTLTVSTVAGTGAQTQETRMMSAPGAGTATGLNSPWDLLKVGRQLFVAMAGHHQIWRMDLDTKLIGPFAGSGRENIVDGPPMVANFAQPSGLASDGQTLYVADSEVSAVRRLAVNGTGTVGTIVGEGLFEFGDVDGVGNAVRLQHALGVALWNGQLVVADTYNSKLKLLNPQTRECRTLAVKSSDGPAFSEPAGISVAGDTAYVADTNASRIRTVNLKTLEVKTLNLDGLTPPPAQKEWVAPKK